jgi:hypothetical protein
METPSALPTGTLTFLFTDIEGSTRLLKALGREGYRELLETHNRLIRSAIAANEGIEVDRQGDAFFAVFRSTGQAIVAAVEARQALVEQGWPEGVQVRVRMGMHTGEARRRGGLTSVSPSMRPHGWAGQPRVGRSCSARRRPRSCGGTFPSQAVCAIWANAASLGSINTSGSSRSSRRTSLGLERRL